MLKLIVLLMRIHVFMEYGVCMWDLGKSWKNLKTIIITLVCEVDKRYLIRLEIHQN